MIERRECGMKRKIGIVDTTLRDGEQRPGLVLSPDEKIRLALFLDQIGVAEIEAGCFDHATEGENYIRKIMEERKNATISVWTRLDPDDIQKAGLQKPDLIHIGVPISYSQIYHKLGKNKKWVENRLIECIEIAKAYQISVTVGLEDVSRANMSFVLHIIRKLEKLEVQTVRLADTVGILSPSRARDMVKEIRRNTDIQLEIHEHNDFGMAIANSSVMLHAGANLVDGTLFGIGERAGNCDLYQLVSSLSRKFDFGVTGSDLLAAEKLMRSICDHEEV